MVNPLPWAILLGGALPRRHGVPPTAAPDGRAARGRGVARRAVHDRCGARALAEDDEPARRPHAVDYVPVALFKLVVHPLLVLALGAGDRPGRASTRLALVVIALVAALPSASNVAMLAERFGADTGRIARIILVSTALAFFTFSAAVTLLLQSTAGLTQVQRAV